MKTYTLKPIHENNPNASSKLPQNFEEKLNPPQKEAVFYGDGPVLLIAGAGSGKTNTLVHRVARLVADGIRPESILLLTFTRKAAQEMLSRASAILDHRCDAISGGTFHAFATKVLRQFGTPIGFNENFTILDRSDTESLLGKIRKEKNYGKGEKRFPQKATLASIIGKASNTGLSYAEILREDYPQFYEFKDDIETISKKYATQKKTLNVMDYDDLLHHLLTLLQTHAPTRTFLQGYFHTIMVDEYQDTNTIQAQIVKLLVNPKNNIMVVGDDAQSIYAFRGAKHENILEFPTQFPGTKIIKLEQNYRSTKPILDLSNAMISGAKKQYPKHLFTDKLSGTKPVYIETKDEHTQSRMIAQKILELREEGVELNKIAILMRSGWHSNDLELELQRQNIPFTKFGGFKFVEAAHIKDLMAYLRILYNPLDNLAWDRVLTQIEGIGPKAITQILDLLLNAFQNGQAPNLSPLKQKPYIATLEALIALVTKQREGQKVAEILQEITQFYTPLFQNIYDNPHKRQHDIESLIVMAEKYTTLEEMLTELTLDPPSNSQSDSIVSQKETEKITLSTIHSAKGLEWHTVFVLSVLDGYIPIFQSLGDLDQIEEERRLLYVALTRAEKNLFILKPHLSAPQRGQSGMQFSQLSRFLSELPDFDSLVEKWAIYDPEDKPFKGLDFDDYPSQEIDEGTSDMPIPKRKYYF